MAGTTPSDPVSVSGILSVCSHFLPIHCTTLSRRNLFQKNLRHFPMVNQRAAIETGEACPQGCTISRRHAWSGHLPPVIEALTSILFAVTAMWGLSKVIQFGLPFSRGGGGGSGMWLGEDGIVWPLEISEWQLIYLFIKFKFASLAQGHNSRSNEQMNGESWSTESY